MDVVSGGDGWVSQLKPGWNSGVCTHVPLVGPGRARLKAKASSPSCHGGTQRDLRDFKFKLSSSHSVVRIGKNTLGGCLSYNFSLF